MFGSTSPTPTAAAAAFAAAEEAARKRFAEHSGGTGPAIDAGILYAWRASLPVLGDEEERRRKAQTKLIGGEEQFDFSMFHREEWERARRKAEEMMAEQQSGVHCYREGLPHPQSKVHGCTQVKVRLVQTNTEMKIGSYYQSMAAGGAADRAGFLLGASLGRFITLAKDRSDSPEAKLGGDLGWVTKGKLDPRIEAVAFNTPRGACSPPFRVKLACFCIMFCEDRR